MLEPADARSSVEVDCENNPRPRDWQSRNSIMNWHLDDLDETGETKDNKPLDSDHCVWKEWWNFDSLLLMMMMKVKRSSPCGTKDWPAGGTAFSARVSSRGSPCLSLAEQRHGSALTTREDRWPRVPGVAEVRPCNSLIWSQSDLRVLPALNHSRERWDEGKSVSPTRCSELKGMITTWRDGQIFRCSLDERRTTGTESNESTWGSIEIHRFLHEEIIHLQLLSKLNGSHQTSFDSLFSSFTLAIRMFTIQRSKSALFSTHMYLMYLELFFWIKGCWKNGSVTKGQWHSSPLTFRAKQKSLGDLNFFFQSRPKKSSTFSNFARQTNSFWTEEDDRWCEGGGNLLCFCLWGWSRDLRSAARRSASSTLCAISPWDRRCLRCPARGGTRSPSSACETTSTSPIVWWNSSDWRRPSATWESLRTTSDGLRRSVLNPKRLSQPASPNSTPTHLKVG